MMIAVQSSSMYQVEGWYANVQRLSQPQIPVGGTFLRRVDVTTGCGACPTVPMVQRLSAWACSKCVAACVRRSSVVAVRSSSPQYCSSRITGGGSSPSSPPVW